jgi:hypothetical protein
MLERELAELSLVVDEAETATSVSSKQHEERKVPAAGRHMMNA